jgi:hypothetical protein
MESQNFYSTVSVIIEIIKPIDVDKLIGHKGCNLKPIATRTGTNIHVEKNTKPTQIVIKDSRINGNSADERINDAKCRLGRLIQDITKEEKKNVRFSDNDDHQHVPPRNHDSRERRKYYEQETSHTTNSRNVRHFKNI